jgi:hypothetical protein
MIDYKSLILNRGKQPIKIVIAGDHHCIRCIRTATALKSVGYEVHGMGSKEAYGIEIYDSYQIYKNEHQFKTSIKTLIEKGVSIIEWNNEPSHQSTWVREVITDTNSTDRVKLISNLHDLDSIRQKVIPISEREMFNVSDALIYVSDSIRDKVNKLQRVTIPTITLYNYPTKKMVESTVVDWENAKHRKGLVYEGGVNPIGNSEKDIRMNQAFKYRNLIPILQQLVVQGNQVFAHIGNPDGYQSALSTGIIAYPPIQFDELMKELVKYKYNIIIFNNKEGTEDQVNFTTPNKLWDGMCAGLPALGAYCKETEKYIKKHKLGLVFDDIEDIKDTKHFENLYEGLIESIRKKREQLIFENQIWMFENLAAKILGVEGKGVPKKIESLSTFEYGNETIKFLLT